MKRPSVKEQIKRIFFYLLCLSLFSEVLSAPDTDRAGDPSDLLNQEAVKPGRPEDGLRNSNGQTNSRLISINTADFEELKSLPGIGDVLAERIIRHRRQFPFKRKEDLMFVKGIGRKRFAQIRDLICIFDSDGGVEVDLASN